MDVLGRVQSVDKAALILKLLARRGREMKLTEISEELGITKSTLHGIISTLKYHGLIDQDKKTQEYRLGLYLSELGDIAVNTLDIRKITIPIIEKISDQLQETVHVGTLDNLEVVYVDKKESNQSMRIFTKIGERIPAYCTGVGKAMLAYMDYDMLLDKLPARLDKLTTNTITDKNELIKELTSVRLNGYAFDNEENSIGLTCVAAPIFDHFKKAKYGISVSGPKARMTDEKIKQCIELIKAAAKEISGNIGYRG